MEYVWWDDNRDMDRGFLDFTADEVEQLLHLPSVREDVPSPS